VPVLVEEMVRRGWLGDKTGQGFYKKVKGDGEKRNFDAGRAQQWSIARGRKRDLSSLEAGKTLDYTRRRLRALVGPILQGQKGDKAQQFFVGSGCRRLVCTRRERVPEISDNIVDVDRAMRWGFGWELGPFEMMDALELDAFAAQVAERRPRAASVHRESAGQRPQKFLPIGERNHHGF